VSPYLDVREIAAALRATAQTVNGWCRTKRLPARRAGCKWLIQREDLEGFLRTDPARPPEPLAA